MFSKVVVANRGAVAARVLRALNALGIRSVAVYSEADAGAPYLEMASEAHAIGPAPARESYLNQEALIEALEAFEIQGIKHNIPAVLAVLRSEPFRAGRVHTGIIPEVLAQKKAA